MGGHKRSTEALVVESVSEQRKQVISQQRSAFPWLESPFEYSFPPEPDCEQHLNVSQ
jgi:hypothetical protein